MSNKEFQMEDTTILHVLIGGKTGEKQGLIRESFALLNISWKHHHQEIWTINQDSKWRFSIQLHFLSEKKKWKKGMCTMM